MEMTEKKRDLAKKSRPPLSSAVNIQVMLFFAATCPFPFPIFILPGKSLSAMRRSFMDSDDDLGHSLPVDPSQAFAEFSFRKIPRDNCVRKVCIRIVLNP